MNATLPTVRQPLVALLAVLGAVVLPSEATSQVKASPFGTVSQTIDGTTVELRYSRPSARGRDLFGDGAVVSWGYMWTPGANWATRLHLSGPVKLEGEHLPAGEYSLWVQPRPSAWEIHLHPNPVLYHTGEYPSPEDFQLSVEVEPTSADHAVEMLTFSFPEVTPTGGTLRMQWGRTAIDLDLEVRPTMALGEMTDEEMEPYLGTYEGAVDTPGGEAPTTIDVTASEGQLMLTISAFGGARAALIPTATPHDFSLAFLRDGEIFNVEDAPAGFEMGPDGANRLVIMGIRGEVWMQGERVR